MPEQLLSPVATPDQKKSFPKAVTEAIRRSSKLRAKVKQLRRALSVKKKAVNLSSYSPVIFMNGDCHGNYDRQVSPRAVDGFISDLGDYSADAVDHPEGVRKSFQFPVLTESFEKVTSEISRHKVEGLEKENLRRRGTDIQHDIAATCVVELFPENNIYVDVCSKQRTSVEETLTKPPLAKPVVRPPVTQKADLYSDVTIFESLDSHAMRVAWRDYTDTAKLLKDLTEICISELDKARVIFRWIVAMDQKNARDKTMRNTNVIGTGGVQCPKVFHTLCRQAGLHSEIIVGYSKGAGHRPGMRLDHKSHRNSWNAVAIDGTWRFVNCTWAARHMAGSRNNSTQLLHKYDEFYCLTDPKEHIYQHFPDDPKWQLLDKPVSLDEFTNLPSLKSPFFKHGLKFSSQISSSLKTNNDSVEIKIDVPEHLKVESRLEMCESAGKQIINRVLQRRIGCQIILTIVPPQPGSYYLSVYAGDTCTSDVLECVFCLRILHAPVCMETESRIPLAYPSMSTLGSTPLMSTLGVSTNSHHDPLINMVNNSLRIDFNIREDMKFTHTLQYHDNLSDSLVDIDRYAFLRNRTDSELSYSVACPRKGSYIFSLYGATRDSNTYGCLFQYLLVCPSDNLSYVSFPRSYSSWRDSSLVSPMRGELVQDTVCVFNLSVKDAVNVLVVVGLEKYPLRKMKDCKWTGEVLTGESSPRATVIAEYTSDAGHCYFTRLLEYDIL